MNEWMNEWIGNAKHLVFINEIFINSTARTNAQNDASTDN